MKALLLVSGLLLAGTQGSVSAQSLHCSGRILNPALGSSTDALGGAISLSGLEVAVGRFTPGSGTGSVHYFRSLPPNGEWFIQQNVIDPIATNSVSYGSELALDGNLLLVSDPDWVNSQGVARGRIHAFSRQSKDQDFTLDHRFSAFENGPIGFGAGLLLANGQAFIAAPKVFFQSLSPNVYVYDYQAGTKTWNVIQDILPPVATLPTAFGASGMDISAGLLAIGDNVTTESGGSSSGACHLYRQDPGTGDWVFESSLEPPFPADGMFFGAPAIISGNSVAVLAEQVQDTPMGPFGGRVYVFTRDMGGVWNLTQTLSSEDFAPAGSMQAFDQIDVDQDLMLVGQSGYDLPNGASQGRAVVYRLDGMGSWSPETTLERGPIGQAGDRLGASLAVDDGRVVVGAPGVNNGILSQGLAVALDLSPEDCDGNLISDACDIFSGLAIDRNSDRIPDSCQLLGTPVCDPAVVNSTGVPGELFGLGLGELGPGLLQVCGSSLPPGQFGYLLGSSGPDMIVMPGGSVGNLCLSVGADFGRYVAQIQQFSPTGIACTVVDFSAIPTAFGPRSLFSGDSWYFQMWYRDGNTSNFTPALEVVIP